MYTIQTIPDPTTRAGEHYRITDADDNRVATCYDIGNAKTVVAALNGAPVLSTAPAEGVCRVCEGALVCELHPDRPWGSVSNSPNACNAECPGPGMLCLVCKREEIERARKVPQPDEEIWNPHAPDCAFRPWYRIRYLDDHFVPPGCTCVMREILRNALLDHIAAWEKLKPIIGVEAFSIRGQAHLQEIQIAMRVLAGDLLPMLMNEPAPTPEEVARWFHEHYERIAKDVGYHTKLESRVPFDKLARIHQTLMTRTADAVLGEIRKVRGGQ